MKASKKHKNYHPAASCRRMLQSCAPRARAQKNLTLPKLTIKVLREDKE